MSLETIQLLKLMRRGYNPDDIPQAILEMHEKKLEEDYSILDKELEKDESEIETKVHSIVEAMQGVAITKEAKEQLEAQKKEVENLTEVQSQYQEGLSSKQEELDKRKKETAELCKKLEDLRPRLRHVPSRYNDVLTNISTIFNENMGKK